MFAAPRVDSLKIHAAVLDDLAPLGQRRELAEGRVWTKISGADRITREGPPYSDVDPFVQAILSANPERVVWGTDWPHINYFDPARMPDDGVLTGLLGRWLPSEQERRRVLVDNPARLYGF